MLGRVVAFDEQHTAGDANLAGYSKRMELNMKNKSFVAKQAYQTYIRRGGHHNSDGRFARYQEPYNPDHAVHPVETIKEMCMYQIFGEKLARDFEQQGVTEGNVIFLTAMFTLPKSFFRNLQKNYEKTLHKK